MRLPILLASAALALLGVPSIATAQNAIAPPAFSGEQHLTAIFGHWTPSGGALQVTDFSLRSLLLPSDRDLLMQSIEEGRVVITGGDASSNRVESPRARMIVLFRGPPAHAVTLPQPDAVNILYVQNGNEFKRYPPDAAVLGRVIQLTPSQDRQLVRYTIDHANGGTHGGSIFIGEPSPRSEPVRTANSVVPPRKVKDARPVYPPEARQARIQGTVIMEIIISQSGKVTEARVLRSLPLLDQAAIDCVKLWEYAPLPSPVVMTVAVTFTP